MTAHLCKIAEITLGQLLGPNPGPQPGPGRGHKNDSHDDGFLPAYIVSDLRRYYGWRDDREAGK
jgi:hypothetical protein